MSSSLGNNLSELDRLLLELNAVQHNPPGGYPADEATRSPSVPGGAGTHYGISENTTSLNTQPAAPAKEKPKRNGGQTVEDVCPSVESLLDELESSVPSPVPAITVNQGEMSSPQRVTSSQQQTRISASSATRELDELMASLSDFKTSSTASLTSEPSLELLPGPIGLDPASTLPSVALPTTSRQQTSGHYGGAADPLTSLPLEVLHIEEDSGSLNTAVIPSTSHHPSRPWAGQPRAEASAVHTSSGAPSNGALLSFSETALSSICSDLGIQNQSLSEANEPWKEEQQYEAKTAPVSVSSSCTSSRAKVPLLKELEQGGAFDPTVVAHRENAIGKVALNEGSNSEVSAFAPRTPPKRDLVAPVMFKPDLLRVDQWERYPGTKSQQGQTTKQDTGQAVEVRDSTRASSCPDVAEKTHSREKTPRKNSLQNTPTGQWKESFSSLAAVPLFTGNAWKEEMDLIPTSRIPVERISTSGQAGITIKSVIKQTRDSSNVHPVCRDVSPRRKLGPAIFHKTVSQDRLIEELQGRLGISKSEQEEWRSPENWLTEGVIIIARPQKNDPDGGQQVEKFMSQGKGGNSCPSSTPPKPGSQLDSMLGSLQSDLNKLGVATVAKGVCGACRKPIAGQVVTAMGKTWHPEHFVCTHCQEEIGSRNFFERDGQPYCEKDYHNLFSPRCYYCNGPILDKVVTALDRTWHPEHFFCAQCGAFFGPEGFHEKDGKAYCRKDYFDMFAPKCGGCARAILENYISALNTLWHPECFVCRECFTPFINGSFFEHDGQPYCEVHYHERRGSLCSGCQKPITGRCITAMAKKFHPEHFVCAFCLKQLNKGTFKEQNDKPYCQNCFLKLFC
ncbi:Paxillin, partial [Varanus komodoensis]